MMKGWDVEKAVSQGVGKGKGLVNISLEPLTVYMTLLAGSERRSRTNGNARNEGTSRT